MFFFFQKKIFWENNSKDEVNMETGTTLLWMGLKTGLFTARDNVT